MEEKKHFYADVWGDTVEIRDLFIAVIIGIVISLSLFILGLQFLQGRLTDVAPNLVKAYALLIGILGSLISAVISASLFKPKRILNEKHFSEEDRKSVLDELGINKEKEAEALKNAEKQVIAEMKSLKLYEIFAGDEETKG
ncbi:hypothetical protein [Aminipila luticellarii]|uniref:Uncharacterized protein n=1 Tax=Aminipila luticellarii TaxID=2507160 RepID=A0A410PTQ8_9FIRM|nr:hypothetical protein [Aminipila luticellarii]QAT42347.1 hypothetical protein EQM06_03370 [Aminipila luticellarii]